MSAGRPVPNIDRLRPDNRGRPGGLSANCTVMQGNRIMRDNFLKLLSKFRRDESGVTLVEYGIAIALAVALGTAALTTLGNEIEGGMIAAGTAMPD